MVIQLMYGIVLKLQCIFIQLLKLLSISLSLLNIWINLEAKAEIEWLPADLSVEAD